MIAVVMGVSGVGKTTIGTALARELGWRFLDADDFHPPHNVAKMAAGQPLNDEDRQPWLAILNGELRELEHRGESAVLACSALKQSYREQLARGLERLQWVHLEGDIDLIRARLAQRRHRFMPAALLESQFAALERPHEAIVVDVSADMADCVAAIVSRVRGS